MNYSFANYRFGIIHHFSTLKMFIESQNNPLKNGSHKEEN